MLLCSVSGNLFALQAMLAVGGAFTGEAGTRSRGRRDWQATLRKGKEEREGRAAGSSIETVKEVFDRGFLKLRILLKQLL